MVHYQNMKKTLWRQKAMFKFFIEGDRNTKYFDVVVNKKRNNNYVQKNQM